jgi:hypothetical protein
MYYWAYSMPFVVVGGRYFRGRGLFLGLFFVQGLSTGRRSINGRCRIVPLVSLKTVGITPAFNNRRKALSETPVARAACGTVQAICSGYAARNKSKNSGVRSFNAITPLMPVRKLQSY